MVKVELIYIPQDKPVFHVNISVEDGSSVAMAIDSSGIENIYPEVKNMEVGIFSHLVLRDQILKSGDRIEIYRPLLIDPKDKRRMRAK